MKTMIRGFVCIYILISVISLAMQQRTIKALEVEPMPGFTEGAKYGGIYQRRYPYADNVEDVAKGARDLWKVDTDTNRSGTYAAAYARVYPKTTFDEGIEAGVNLTIAAVRAGATNTTLEQIKYLAYREKVKQQEGIQNPESRIQNQAELGTNGKTNAVIAAPGYSVVTDGEKFRVKGPDDRLKEHGFFNSFQEATNLIDDILADTVPGKWTNRWRVANPESRIQKSEGETNTPAK